jgi:nitroreductase
VTAAAAGLGAVFMTAFSEQPLEGLLCCDYLAEIPIGITALGHPATSGEPDPTGLP